MPYPAKTIANYFIEKAIEQGDKTLNPMKLLKLIYIAHGWSLAVYNKPLIDETIEAWKYGPVIPNVYHSVKHFGMNPIAEVVKDLDIDDQRNVVINKYEENFPEETKEFLGQIIKAYKENTGIQLSNWSHKPDSPWDKAWRNGGNKRDFCSIPNEDIKQYFLQWKKEHQNSSHVIT